MTNIKHIMLDLETWGKRPGNNLRSIGACVFDPITGRVCDNALTYGVMNDPDGKTDGSFYIAMDNPSVDISEMNHRHYKEWHFVQHENRYYKYPLTRDPETVKWWDDQSEEAQAAFADPVDLALALERFADWLCNIVPNDQSWPSRGLRLYTHGPHFDISILAAAYHACDLPVPWHYRAPRDTRTAFDMAGIDDDGDGSYRTFMTAFNTGTAHHALHDAIAQARAVCAAYRMVNPVKSEPTAYLAINDTTRDEEFSKLPSMPGDIEAGWRDIPLYELVNPLRNMISNPSIVIEPKPDAPNVQTEGLRFTPDGHDISSTDD